MKIFYRTLVHLLFFLLTMMRLTGQIEMPIEINDGGYIFLTVKINDTDEAKFMLDTGAGINVISPDLFEKLSPEKAGLHTGTRHNGETITGMVYKLTSLSVGSLKKVNVVAGIYDKLQNCDGLLSMDYFRDVPFTIDFIYKKLVIETPESLSNIAKNAERIPIELKRNGKNELDFFVNICANDSVRMKAEFDTGSGFNMLMVQPRFLKSLHIDLPEKKQDYGYYLYSTFLSSLTYCGSTKLRNEHVFIGFKEGLIYEALIGSGMFRNKKLTINLAQSEMFSRN